MFNSWNRIMRRSSRIILVTGLCLSIAGAAFAQRDRSDNSSDAANRTSVQPIGSAAGGNSTGGAAQADFDTLIELITATVKPDTWEDVGGEGSIQGFPGGVFVDASGVMRKVDAEIQKTLGKKFRRLDLARVQANRDAFKSSKQRKVSLKQLEAEVARLAASEKRPDESMLHLAGLTRIDYLIIDDDNQDVVLVGPAGKWMTNEEGRVVSGDTRRPVLHLDDLVVVLRNVFLNRGQFTCSITPTPESLAEAQAYISRTTTTPLKPGKQERETWVDGLRTSMGNQRIDVEGIPHGSRLARTIIEADYHMKLVGIGLEPCTDEMVSYLDSIEIPKGATPPPLGVLRWWFTLNDESVIADEARRVFALKKQAVQVLSENELLTSQGKRVHTGEAEDLNRQFAQSFTKHFSDLAKRYPIYADLENVFELAVVAAILNHHDASNRADWSMKFFLDAERGYQIEEGRIAREVPTVVNHRVIDGKHIVAAVSGGVSVDSKTWTTSHTSTRPFKNRDGGLRRPNQHWWWD